MLAAQGGHVEVIDALVSEGANVEATVEVHQPYCAHNVFSNVCSCIECLQIVNTTSLAVSIVQGFMFCVAES